ncbi:MAG: helix-turn-helix transcriptional regulator [Deltaproteobacteria bacterium]|nr:MAG: helix-turn-helix transcriptional regulator [Deltaproteobacteria bacterium]TMQ13525.1 MAG: helix-turn-helix transcriptional regulator [Deltaproteobacteria bacterium]
MPWEIPNDPLVTLSARESQIADALMTGATAKEIARDLLVSFHTIRTHIRNIYNKLGVCNRVELMRWAAMQRATAAARGPRVLTPELT